MRNHGLLQAATPGRTWAVILAGGEGRRLTGTIRNWLGEPRPKQYCTFVGTRSMLQHTIDRAQRIVAPDHVVTVVAPHHERFVREAVRRPQNGLWISQPQDKGTAAGVYFALAHVLACDPQAVVVLLPSDHFVSPEGYFVHQLRRMVSVVRANRRKVVLLGAEADRPEVDFGWIVANGDTASPFGEPACRSIRRFVEKPDPESARALHAGGAMWNTMILAADARRLWSLGSILLPGSMPFFYELRMMLSRPHGGRGDARGLRSRLESGYRSLSPRCFSRDVIGPASGRISLQVMRDVRWSDWGRPERIVESLRMLGRRPFFLDAPSRAAQAPSFATGIPCARPAA